ncbi:MAG TPA: hypothetical protein VK932_20765 [Kofleriaceae bacterium]|nr:hypothetical protein [Kofleriaceae bacterium]
MASVLDLARINDSGDLAGGVGDIAAAVGPNAMLVTAVRTEERTLKLITWRLNAAGPVTRLGDSGAAAGVASDLAIAVGALYVVACRTSDGKLKLISWEIDATGSAITRRGDSGGAAGEATLIDLVSLSPSLFVTACRTAAGDLKLISWRLNRDGSLTRLHDSGGAAGRVSEIALCKLASNRVATAVRDADGDLKVITWAVSSAGELARLGDTGNAAGRATRIRCVVDTAGRLITSVRDADGDLKLISWRVSSDGRAIARLGDTGDQAGDIGDNSLVALSDGVVSGVRAGNGSLKLIAWRVDGNGAFTRRGDSAAQAGVASQIQLVAGPGVPDAAGHSVTLATALRTAAGRLKIITWGPPVVRLHVKVLVEPATFTRAEMLQGMRDVFASVGFGVEVASVETLDLPPLETVDVGDCAGETTTEQERLFANRNNVGPDDIVAYFVRATTPPLNGCATSPAGRPSVIVVRTASRWTLGHEIGHVLGLRHVNDRNRLMTGGGTSNITNPPPDLVPAEQSTMIDSRLSVPA